MGALTWLSVGSSRNSTCGPRRWLISSCRLALLAYAAGGSAGSRTSLTLAVRHPEVVKGVFIWEVSGGPRVGELMAPGYYGQYIEAAERGGMAAVAETEFFAQRIQDNPSNRERLLSMDVQAFCAVRWFAAFAAPNPVGDLTEAQLQTITCPVVLARQRLMTCTTYRRRKTCIAWSSNCGPQPGRTRWGCHRTARPHVPGHCRHQPLRHEGGVFAAELLDFIRKIEG